MGVRTEEVWLLMEQLGGRTQHHPAVLGVYVDEDVAKEDLRRMTGGEPSTIYRVDRWDVDHEPVATKED